MAGSALKRLMAEYKQLTLNPPEGIIAGPVNEENFFEWEALITGEICSQNLICILSQFAETAYCRWNVVVSWFLHVGRNLALS